TLARLLAIPFEHPASPPRKDAVGQDVVEDLVALASAGAVDGTDDALAAENVQHRRDVGLSNRRVLREVTRAVGDLPSGGRDKVVEHRRGDVLLFRLQPAESPLEMRPDDRLRAAELVERRQAENGRSPLALDLPEPLQHELQVRRLDPLLVRLDAAAARATDVDLARGDLVEHCLDQLRLDANVLTRELVVALDRADDRRARAAPVEVVEPEVVR